MTDISYNNLIASSDLALMMAIGLFIKHHRLQQNKTQGQLAKEAGIARSTVTLFERGENTSLVVFIQILRALKLLHMLQDFQATPQISPLELARIEQSTRKRAQRSAKNEQDPTPKSEW